MNDWSSPGNHPSRSRVLTGAGAALMLAGTLQVVGDTVYALDRVYPGDPGFAFANLVAATWHLGMLVAVAAIAMSLRSRLPRLGRVGFAFTGVGLGLLIAAEVVTQLAGEIPIILIAASAPITGLGLILAGVGCLRADVDRLLGVAVLIAGGYALALIVPTSAGPAGANYFVIAGWGVTWLLLGAAAVRASLGATNAGVVSTAVGQAATR